MATNYKEINGTSYNELTDPKVVAILEKMINKDARIRLDYGFTKTQKGYNTTEEAGQSWGEDYDVEGYLRRSSGQIKVPILVYNSASSGGGAILDSSIVAIYETNGKALYKHPNYKPLMDWTKCVIEPTGPESFPFEIKGQNNKTGEYGVQARFQTASKAKTYLDKRLKFEKPAVKKADLSTKKDNTKI